MNYRGVIIEESLSNKAILRECHIISTKISKVTKKDETPWLKQWTLHTVEIEPEKVNLFARQLSQAIEQPGQKKGDAWYADFNDGKTVYVIFSNKIFTWKIGDQIAKKQASNYGIKMGIPKHQVNWPEW